MSGRTSHRPSIVELEIEASLPSAGTATVSIEVARRDGVLRVPTSALKFKPDSAVLAHFGAKPAAAGQAATVWVSEGSTIKPVAVKTGLSDAVYTELLDAPFAEASASHLIASA